MNTLLQRRRVLPQITVTEYAEAESTLGSLIWFRELAARRDFREDPGAGAPEQAQHEARAPVHTPQPRGPPRAEREVTDRTRMWNRRLLCTLQILKKLY